MSNPKTKGTDIIALRKILLERGPNAEKSFFKLLSPDNINLYHTILPLSWTPIQNQNEIYNAAIQVLFPNEPEPACTLGKIMAEKSYSTIYKLFLRIPSPAFLITQAAKIWKTYYDKGSARIENITPTSSRLVVSDFPELPATLRGTVSGHLLALIQMTGKKKVQVVHNDSTPMAWIWDVSWE